MATPLIDAQLYDRLTARRAQMEKAGFEGLAPVFVPTGPAPLTDLPVRLLFVGQATQGPVYGSSLDFDSAAKGSEAILAQCLSDFQSPFWVAVRKILRYALLTVGAENFIQRLEEMGGWSNLVKVGLLERNPQGGPNDSIITEQADLCIESLRQEIRTFQPTATVLMTGTIRKPKSLIQFSVEKAGTITSKRRTWLP
jgi:hypothetical protein